MIVITSLDRKQIHLLPGDTFHLSVRNSITGTTDIITELITVDRLIDFVASFRFAKGNGTVSGFHLMGFFGNSQELPIEMQSAKLYEDLTAEQKINFDESVGIYMRKAA